MWERVFDLAISQTSCSAAPNAGMLRADYLVRYQRTHVDRDAIPL